MKDIEKAGNLLILMGWFTLVIVIATTILIGVGIFLGLAIFLPYVFEGMNKNEIFIFLMNLLIPTLLMSVICIKVGGAVKNNKKWAIISGVLIAVLSLPGFPIGTIIGLAALFYFFRDWRGNLKA